MLPAVDPIHFQTDIKATVNLFMSKKEKLYDVKLPSESE